MAGEECLRPSEVCTAVQDSLYLRQVWLELADGCFLQELSKCSEFFILHLLFCPFLLNVLIATLGH